MTGLIRLQKVHEDSDAIFITEIRLSANGSIPIKDSDGFVVGEITSNGDLKLRGGVKRV